MVRSSKGRPARRGRLVLIGAYVVALVAGAYFVYVVMPRALGGTTLEGYRAMAGDPNITMGALIWFVASLPALVVQWFRASAASTWRRDYPGSIWRSVRSALYVFGVPAIAWLYPWVTMSHALAHVLPAERLTPEGAEVRLVAIGGVLAILVALGMTIIDAVRGQPAADATSDASPPK